MDHVTYLFGAGASFKALPLNNKSLEELGYIITKGKEFLNNSQDQNYLNNFLNWYSPILEEAKAEVSLDTLAMININNREKLNRIKTLIWLYFSAKAGQNKLDSRYKNLLVKLRDDNTKNFRVNDNCSFLSWNYDLQLEEAYATLATTDIWEVPKHLYSYPGIHFVNPDAIKRNSSPKSFQMIHLNGCAGYYKGVNSDSYKSWYNCDFDKIEDYDRMINLISQEFHTNNNNPLHRCINFARENNEDNKFKNDQIKLIAEKTTHLVIIGYSFPDFNKLTDRHIIDNMKNLKEILIQDLEAVSRKEKLLQMFPQLNNNINTSYINIVLDDKCQEFQLPYGVFQ